MALLVQKFMVKFFWSKSVFSYFKSKKNVPMVTKLEEGGGGKALVARPLKILFLRIPLAIGI